MNPSETGLIPFLGAIDRSIADAATSRIKVRLPELATNERRLDYLGSIVDYLLDQFEAWQDRRNQPIDDARAAAVDSRFVLRLARENCDGTAVVVLVLVATRAWHLAWDLAQQR